jgi:hypothetical protein
MAPCCREDRYTTHTPQVVAVIGRLNGSTKSFGDQGEKCGGHTEEQISGLIKTLVV